MQDLSPLIIRFKITPYYKKSEYIVHKFNAIQL